QVIEEAAEEVAHRAQHLAREDPAPRDDEVAVRAQMADLVAAVELAEGGLRGGVGIEREERRPRAEIGGFAGPEPVGPAARARRAAVPSSSVGEQGGEAAPDIAPAGHRAEIVHARENAQPRKALEHAEIEGRRADPAAGQREADGEK